MKPQRSLKRQLLLWLLLPQLVLWLVGSTLAYRLALSYAEKGIDQSLTQSVRSLARQVKPVGSGLLIDFPKAAQAIIEEDPSDKVSYMVSSPPGMFVLGNATLPTPPSAIVQGLQQSDRVQLYRASLEAAESEPARTLRVAVLELNYGDAKAPQRLRVQVAKSLAVQERIARELIIDIVVPLLLLGAAISVLVYAGIARGLRPLQRLQTKLGEKSATALSPIEMRAAPQEVHSLATAVNQLLTAVQRSVSQEKRFLNDAAHQLRTPLAGLKSQLDLAMREKVNAGVERSSHLVHQLLRLARSEAEIELVELDIAQLAQELARDAAPAALAAGIDFGYEGEEHITHRANALLLREALSNLIDNAVRYAGHGSAVTLRVRRDLAHSPSGKATVVLEVEDNGPGVSDAARAHIFERFYRASDLPGGAGLGLAIVQEVVLRHGGVACAVAVVPHGLCIQIRL
jgi:two-component system, OmpR family, sensor histidine kinase TctE